MGSTGPLDSTFPHLTGGLVKPVKLFKKLAAVCAAAFVMVGIAAGTASASPANSGEITTAPDTVTEYTVQGNSGEIT
jgi:hypothetical protein